jgi:hypothetical protein
MYLLEYKFIQETSRAREREETYEFLLVTECDFCGQDETEVILWRNHYEEHLPIPREVNICNKCHASIHKELRYKRRFGKL